MELLYTSHRAVAAKFPAGTNCRTCGVAWPNTILAGLDRCRISLRQPMPHFDSLAKRPMKAILLFLFCVNVFATSASAATPGEVAVGAVLREADLSGFSGGSRKLSTLRGKPLIINVWASWCAPCRVEMGSLERLARRYGGKKFNVIGISTDDDFHAAAAFLAHSGITFANYHDKQLQMENMLGANMIPLTVLVDARGRVLKKWRGYREWDNAESLALIGSAFRIKM